MTRSFRISCLCWIIAAGILGSPEVSAAPAPRGEVEVHQSIVKLSDVFVGIADDADDAIAQAPAPCRKETYDVNVLVRLANKYHLDWKPHSIADHVVVSAACTRIPAGQIAAAVRKALVDNGTLTGSKTSADVAFDNHALEIDLPAGDAAGFTLNNFTYDPVSKYFHADVVAESSSGPFAVPVTGHVSVKRSVPVLVRRLESGMVIAAEDITWMEVPEDRVNASVVMDTDQLVGRELSHDTDGDEILHTHDVAPPRLVARGKIVTLKIETSFMTLMMQGKALQDGSAGDVVRVLNMQSDRVVEGIAESDGVVRIATPERMAAVQGEAEAK